jgi:hypothetical protein
MRRAALPFVMNPEDVMVTDETRNEDGKIVEPDRRQKPPPPEAAPGPQVVNADTVRSAPPGRPVLLVLSVSLAAIIAVFAVIYAFFASSAP